MKQNTGSSTPITARPLRAILALTLGLALLPTLSNTAPTLPATAEAGLTSGDWQAIRTGMDDHRHQVRANGEQLVADNPGQRWQLRFDQQGFLVQPAAGDWQ